MVQWDLPPSYFFPKAIVGPTPAITSPLHANCPWWHISALFLPYFTISSLVAPNFFTTCKFVSGGTVRPIPCKPLPYCTISSLVAQWDLPPLYFLPSDTVGPTPAKTHSLHANSPLVAQWDPFLPNSYPTSQFLP